MVLARAQTFAPYPKDQGQTRHLLPDWGAVTLAWSPRVNIRAKYEVTSEFNPRGGQVLLSHSKDAVLFHPHHRACHPLPSLPSYKRVHRQSVCESQPFPSHPTGGYPVPVGGRTLSRCSKCVEPPWPMGKRSDPSHSLRFQLPPSFQEALRVCPN